MSSIVKTPYSEKVIARLPQHLKRFIVPQNYELYSAIDQAVWRFVMRKNMSYLKKIAHKSYIDGLRKAGIGTETIPNIYGMNRILKEIGWAAVAVDGLVAETEMKRSVLTTASLLTAVRSTLISHVLSKAMPDCIVCMCVNCALFFCLEDVSQQQEEGFHHHHVKK